MDENSELPLFWLQSFGTYFALSQTLDSMLEAAKALSDSDAVLQASLPGDPTTLAQHVKLFCEAIEEACVVLIAVEVYPLDEPSSLGSAQGLIAETGQVLAHLDPLDLDPDDFNGDYPVEIELPSGPHEQMTEKEYVSKHSLPRVNQHFQAISQILENAGVNSSEFEPYLPFPSLI